MKSGAMGKGGQVENWNDECFWKTLKIMSGFLLWFQSFLICESWFTCDSTAPHKAVAQNGAFKKITAKEERLEGEERKKNSSVLTNILNLLTANTAANCKYLLGAWNAKELYSSTVCGYQRHGKLLLYNQSLLSLRTTVRESRPRNAANKYACIKAFCIIIITLS